MKYKIAGIPFIIGAWIPYFFTHSAVAPVAMTFTAVVFMLTRQVDPL